MCTNLLLHLGRHFALDDLQSIFSLVTRDMPFVADGKAALAQHLTDLICGAIFPVSAGWLVDHGRRRRRMVLLLLRDLGSQGCFDFGGVGGTIGWDLGVYVPR